MDCCEKCGWQDTEEIGDYDSMVAGCSNCQEVVCGMCWDKYHADTCSQQEGEK